MAAPDPLSQNKARITALKSPLERLSDPLKIATVYANECRTTLARKTDEKLSVELKLLEDKAAELKSLQEGSLAAIRIYTAPTPPALDADNNDLGKTYATLKSNLDRIYAESARVQAELVTFRDKLLRTPGYKVERKAASEAAAARPGAKPKGGKIPEWADDKVIENVRKELKKLRREDALKELNDAYELYQSTEPNSADGVKAATIMKTIVMMPGWGHVPLHKNDEMVFIKRSDFEKRKALAFERYKAKRLAGTEGVAFPIIKAYFQVLEKMVANPPTTKAGDPLKGVSAKDLVLPVFCIDGPPGVGKTTIAQAIAFALETPYEYLRMQNSSPGQIVGYIRQYGTPKPSATTTTKIKSGRTSAVTLLDELDKGERATQDAVAGITETGESDVRDEYLEIGVPKGLNLIIATTNNYGLLPTHLQSRMGPNKLYFGGYDDPTKEIIMKNMALSVIGNRDGYIKFLSKGGKGGKGDPKSYKVEDRDLVESYPSTALVKPGAGDEDIDAIQYIVEKYITEVGVREAGALLKKVVDAASEEYSTRLNAEAARIEQATGQAADLDTIKIDPVKIDKALIHKALKEPDPLIEPIKKLNVVIIKERKKFNKLIGQLHNKIDNLSGEISAQDRLKTSAQLAEFERQRAMVATFENQLVQNLDRRLDETEDLDAETKKIILDQRKEHLEILANMQDRAAKVTAKVNRYIGKAAVPPELFAAADRLMKKKSTDFSAEDRDNAFRLVNTLLQNAQSGSRDDVEQNALLIEELLERLSAIKPEMRDPEHAKTIDQLRRQLEELRTKKREEAGIGTALGAGQKPPVPAATTQAKLAASTGEGARGLGLEETEDDFDIGNEEDDLNLSGAPAAAAATRRTQTPAAAPSSPFSAEELAALAALAAGAPPQNGTDGLKLLQELIAKMQAGQAGGKQPSADELALLQQAIVRVQGATTKPAVADGILAGFAAQVSSLQQAAAARASQTGSAGAPAAAGTYIPGGFPNAAADAEAKRTADARGFHGLHFGPTHPAHSVPRPGTEHGATNLDFGPGTPGATDRDLAAAGLGGTRPDVTGRPGVATVGTTGAGGFPRAIMSANALSPDLALGGGPRQPGQFGQTGFDTGLGHAGQPGREFGRGEPGKRGPGIVGTMAGRDAYMLRAFKVGQKKGTKHAPPLTTAHGMEDLCKKMIKSVDNKSVLGEINTKLQGPDLDLLLKTDYEDRQKARVKEGKKQISFEEWKSNRDVKQEVFENAKITPASSTEYNIQVKNPERGGTYETKAYVKLLSETESARPIPELPAGRKIELGFTTPQPGDKEIEILLENAKEISRRTGNNKIHFEQCEGCPEKLDRIIELATKMELRVTYDDKSKLALDSWKAEHGHRPSSHSR